MNVSRQGTKDSRQLVTSDLDSFRKPPYVVVQHSVVVVEPEQDLPKGLTPLPFSKRFQENSLTRGFPGIDVVFSYAMALEGAAAVHLRLAGCPGRFAGSSEFATHQVLDRAKAPCELSPMSLELGDRICHLHVPPLPHWNPP